MKKIFFFLILFFPLQANAGKLKLLEVFGSEMDPILIKIGDVSQNSKLTLKALTEDYFEERQEKVAAGYYLVNSQNWLTSFKNKEINFVLICKDLPLEILAQNKLIHEEIFTRNGDKCYAIYDQKPRALIFGFTRYLTSIRAQNISSSFSKMP